MIGRTHDFPIARQAKALNISRGAVYCKPRPVPAQDLEIMRRLDELHLEHPFMGARMLRDMLNRAGVSIGRRHAATPMKRMGIEAVYRRPDTSKPAPGHKIYPYLLRGLKIEKPNQVWAVDITYIPMARGFVYLAAIVDWVSRRVLPHRDADQHGGGVLHRGAGGGPGETRQAGDFQHGSGQQFTSEAFTGMLIKNGIAISMDGKRSWRDNVFVERLWKPVKYEEVYLKACDSAGEARASIGRYLDFYNRRRPHSSLDRHTPDEAYFGPAPLPAAA